MAAPKKQSNRDRKRQLALILTASRSNLTASGVDLRRRLSPGRVARNCLQRHPFRIFGATTAGVALLTILLRPRRYRGQKSPKSVLRHLLGWVISLAKPVIRLWILKQAKMYLQTKQVVPETDSLLGP